MDNIKIYKSTYGNICIVEPIKDDYISVALENTRLARYAFMDKYRPGCVTLFKNREVKTELARLDNLLTYLKNWKIYNPKCVKL